MEDKVHRESGAPQTARTAEVLSSEHLSLSVEGSQAARAAASQGTQGNMEQSFIGPVHVRLGIPRGLPATTDLELVGPSKRARKERGPNWNAQEIYELIAAKRKIALLETDKRDERELMVPESMKWQRISVAIMASSFPRDATACKSKWNQVIPEYKRIFDFFARSERNEMTYWTMSSLARQKEGLQRAFPHDVFCQIREWYGKQPAVLPPHSQDFLSLEDTMFFNTQVISPQVPPDGSHEVSADLEDTAAGDTDSTTESTKSPSCGGRVGAGPFCRSRCVPAKSDSPMPTMKRSLPAGVTPQILSSSDTAGTTIPKRPANTTIRRKNLAGHSLIVEVTKVTGATMANEIRDMAVSGRQLEQSKIDLQQALFKQQMDYQKERDLRTQENAKFKHEQSILSLAKQTEMVEILVSISIVLKATFLSRQFQSEGTERTWTPRSPPRKSVAADDSIIAKIPEGS